MARVGRGISGLTRRLVDRRLAPTDEVRTFYDPSEDITQDDYRAGERRTIHDVFVNSSHATGAKLLPDGAEIPVDPYNFETDIEDEEGNLVPILDYHLDLPSTLHGLFFRLLDSECRLARVLNNPLNINQLNLDAENFDYRLAIVDKKQAQTLEPTHRSVFERLMADLEQRFFSIAQAYQTLFPQITEHGAPRKTRGLFAWTKQTYRSVKLDFKERALPLKEFQNEALFKFFVDITVLFVILFDDVTEANKGPEFDKLLAVINIVKEMRLERKPVILNSVPGYNELSEAQRKYVGAINEAFDLLYDSIEALCFKNRLDANTQSQMKKIQKLMEGALRELFDQMDFGTQMDELLQGKIKSFKTLIPDGQDERELVIDQEVIRSPGFTEIFQKKTAPKMQMRFMLLASFMQDWASKYPEERKKLNFEELLGDVNAFGRAIEILGLTGNDVGTICRELAQKDRANSILIQALSDGIISCEEIDAAFDAFDKMGQKEAVGFMSRLAMVMITKEEKSLSMNEQSVSPAITNLIRKIFGKGGPFIKIVSDWRQNYKEFQEVFCGSSLAKSINFDSFCRRQLKFMLQYAQASPFI